MGRGRRRRRSVEIGIQFRFSATKGQTAMTTFGSLVTASLPSVPQLKFVACCVTSHGPVPALLIGAGGTGGTDGTGDSKNGLFATKTFV